MRENIQELNDGIHQAFERIRPHVRRTYLEPSPWLSEVGGCQVFLKLENLQYTGSFKLRGALNKLLSLSSGQATRGVVTASTGNHALAVTHALRITGGPGKIYLPPSVAPGKLAALRRSGVELELFGDDPIESELEARRVAGVEGKTYVSPYNDLQVVAGQGTIGLELIQQLPDLDALFVAVGGGGLISGIGAALKFHNPSVRLIGCQPGNSPVMSESLLAGEIIDLPFRETLSDATAGAIEKGTCTFELCRLLVDEFVVASEEQIASAMRRLIEYHHLLVEGSAALAVAAFLAEKGRYQDKKVVLVMCGGNLSMETLRKLL